MGYIRTRYHVGRWQRVQQGEAFVIDNVRVWLGDEGKVTLQQRHLRALRCRILKSQRRRGDKVSDLADGRCLEDS